MRMTHIKKSTTPSRRNKIALFDIVLVAMVNRGPSKGCVTCKQRRVKCDEAKPECQMCRRLGLRCGGYRRKNVSLKFKDQSHKFYSTEASASRAIGFHDRTVSPSPHQQLSEPDTSVSFFLGNYASIGRRMGSARGFYEVLIPVYCSQPQNSPLSLAVTAVASEVLSLWRHDGSEFRSTRKNYARAVTHLRTAIQDRRERGNPATLLAVLTLQLYDSLAAIYGLRPATRIHHNGAVSLLTHTNPDHDATTSAYVQRFILHAEVSSALRQKRPLQSIACSFIGRSDLLAAPENPSSALDAIGASVVELQASYMTLATHGGLASSSKHILSGWIVEAKRIDEHLLAWARYVPDCWQPLKLVSGRDIDPSIPTYRSVCEVYPSCQIASIWNLWRVQRLILAKITLGSLNTLSCRSKLEPTEGEISGGIEDFVECKRVVLELVDSMCRSVPFYLGNRTKVSSIADFTDPTILLPSCDSLVPANAYNAGMPRDEHKHHIIAQGPFQVMSPLSRLLTLFLEDYGQLMVTFLRPGQHNWIRAQFLRVAALVGLAPGDSKEESRLLNSSAQGLVHVGVEDIATRIRKGAMFMSGP